MYYIFHYIAKSFNKITLKMHGIIKIAVVAAVVFVVLIYAGKHIKDKDGVALI